MSLYQYGNDITYQSLPDYDTLVPFDTAWDCEDWRIYFERLEEEFGTDQARRIWNDAWSNNGANADVLSCKYGDAWRNWADSNGLIYDHLILGQIDSWMYDTEHLQAHASLERARPVACPSSLGAAEAAARPRRFFR